MEKPEEKPPVDKSDSKEKGRGRKPVKHGSLERKPGLPGRQRTRSESLTRKEVGTVLVKLDYSQLPQHSHT